jgi:dihydrofolate reductase
MTRPSISLIAAVALNRAIGRGNELLWTERADQQHFRRVTMGAPVVMGRKTWESLPARFRPLPGRTNIVLTRDPTWQAEGAQPATTLEAALSLARSVSPEAPKVFVIGGAEVYALALPLADELVLTEIDARFEADRFFPAWNPAAFSLVSREAQVDANGVPFAFSVYRRHPELPATR